MQQSTSGFSSPPLKVGGADRELTEPYIRCPEKRNWHNRVDLPSGAQVRVFLIKNELLN